MTYSSNCDTPSCVIRHVVLCLFDHLGDNLESLFSSVLFVVHKCNF